ncbi:MAG: tRNA pseudouridine(38-40) synthase TruA [Actinomycetota bacterium]|nr:tRNA pseudouridine(38-40) synthase TruA [Actinomycetota bacterium]
MRLRLDVCYDGADFSGWAAQPGRRTVQGEVEAALATVLRLPRVAVTCAGRTDAGVHARGQVGHADLPDGADGPDVMAPDDLRRRLAGVLPADVRVPAVTPAPAGFDARFSAVWRRYAYRVYDDPAGLDPLRRHHLLAWPRSLDLAAMNAAAGTLLGEHDFAAFCRRREGATTVRTLLELSWSREPDGVAVARIVADAFCHNMVRALVGAMLSVGEGRRDPAWPAAVLGAGRRDPAVRVVAAHGLTLEEVGYPPPAELAARAEQARAVRMLPS